MPCRFLPPIFPQGVPPGDYLDATTTLTQGDARSRRLKGRQFPKRLPFSSPLYLTKTIFALP